MISRAILLVFLLDISIARRSFLVSPRFLIKSVPAIVEEQLISPMDNVVVITCYLFGIEKPIFLYSYCARRYLI